VKGTTLEEEDHPTTKDLVGLLEQHDQIWHW